MAFSDDDDEFDDISLPDLEMVDLTIYDTPTQPMSRPDTMALSRTPSVVLPASKSKPHIKSEPSDASEWDIPIRIDSNGEYVQGCPLPSVSQVAFPELPQSSIPRAQSNHNGHTDKIQRHPSAPIKKTRSNPAPQSRFLPQPFAPSSIQNEHLRAILNPTTHPNPRPPSRLRSNENIPLPEGMFDTAKLPVEGPVEKDLQEIQRKNEELNQLLKEQAQALLTAKGETSNLRRSLKDTETKAAQNLAAITAQHAAELEKRNRRDEERRLEEEGRRAKSIFDNHNAATYSTRRPQWSTQSSIPRSQSRVPPPFSDFLPSSQTIRGGDAGHSTPKISRVDVRAGEGGSQGLAGGSSLNGKSEAVSPGRDSQLKEEKRAMLPPPPKFRGLKNTFNPSKSLGMRQPSFSQDRPPPTSQPSRVFRVPFKNPPSLSQNVDAPAELSSSPESLEQLREEERGMKRRRVNYSATGKAATEEKREMMAELMVKGNSQSDVGEVVDQPDASGQTVVDEVEEENQNMEDNDLGMEDLVLEDEDEAEDLFWRSQEKSILFSVVFTDQAFPSTTLLPPPTSLPSVVPLTPSSPFTQSPVSVTTIQQILAPLPTESSSFRDRIDHSNACARILNALGGASFSGLGTDPLNEVIRGLNATAKVFERLNMVSTLNVTLKLIHCILLHIPRASRILLHLPSFLSLITSIKNTYLPFPIKPPSSSRPPFPSQSQNLPAAASTASPSNSNSSIKELEKYADRTAVVMRLLYVIESCAWEADSGSDSDVLSRIIQLPRFTSALLDASVPIRIVLQTLRIINYLCFDELLFRPLLSYPDHAVEQPPPTRDPARVPLIEQLCKLVREPPNSASSGELLLLSLEISSFFRVLCEKHEEEAIILFGQSQSLIPTLIFSLERDSSIIWGIDPSSSQLQQSIPSLFPMLSLLYSLTVPVSSLDNHGTPTVNLTDKLRQAPRREFNALFDKFMVAFGRICYADAPELEDILERAGPGEEMGDFDDEDVDQEDVDARRSEKADRLVVELERAGEIARDIFDQVVEGPEGDLVYDVFSDQRSLDDVPIEVGQDQDQEDPEGFEYPEQHAQLDFPSSSIPPEETEAVQIAFEVAAKDEKLKERKAPKSSFTRSGATMTRKAAAAAAAEAARQENTDQPMVPDSDDELTDEEGDDEIQVLS